MPRCRTAWCSRFLSYGEFQCGHDELRHCRSLEDVRSWLSLPLTGTVETAAAPFWRLLPAGVTVATIRRPISEVLASLRRGGLVFDDAPMQRLMERTDAKLVQIARRLPNVLATTFEELGTEEGCARLFEHCLPYAHDHAWWAQLAPINMQVSIPHMTSYFLAYAPQIEKLRRIAAHRSIAAMARPVGLNGVVYAREPWARFIADAPRLLSLHCEMAGEAPDGWTRTNLPMFEAMDRQGALHIVTARSNGLMCAYHMASLSGGYDAIDRLDAEQILLFADPAYPGLGLKMARAAVAELRIAGAKHLLLQAGSVASGPRYAAICRRLGAMSIGERFLLEL